MSRIEEALKALRVLTRLYTAEVIFEAAAELLVESKGAGEPVPSPPPPPPPGTPAEPSARRPARPGPATKRVSAEVESRLEANADEIRDRAPTWRSAAALLGVLDRRYPTVEEAAKAYRLTPSTVYAALWRMETRALRDQARAHRARGQGGPAAAPDQGGVQ